MSSTPYQKGEEVEKDTFVFDYVSYGGCPFKTHVRVVTEERGDLQEIHVPLRGGKHPSEVPIWDCHVVVHESDTPEREELASFLETCRAAA